MLLFKRIVKTENHFHLKLISTNNILLSEAMEMQNIVLFNYKKS